MPGTSADDLSETGEKQVEHESAFSRAKHGEEGLITKEEEMNCHFSSRIQTLDYRCLERICVFKQIKKDRSTGKVDCLNHRDCQGNAGTNHLSWSDVWPSVGPRLKLLSDLLCLINIH